MSDLKLFNKNLYLFYCLCSDNFSFVNKRVGPSGTRSHWVYPLKMYIFHHENVGDIFMFVEFLNIVVQRGTKTHWVNPLKIFKQNYVDILKISMYKNICCGNIQIKRH